MRDLVWYPQLDLYDTIRRFILIITACQQKPLSKERLYIYDFFLVNTALLHKTKMTKHVREEFGELKIPKRDFLEYPPAPVLFEKMAGVQAQAFQNVVGRGLLDLELLRADSLCLSAAGSLFQKKYRLCTGESGA